MQYNIIVSDTIYTPAECVPDCQNGGVCTEPDVCRCSSGWLGDKCQKGINFINKLLIVVTYICIHRLHCKNKSYPLKSLLKFIIKKLWSIIPTIYIILIVVIAVSIPLKYLSSADSWSVFFFSSTARFEAEFLLKQFFIL